jgi:long-chain fatty acid transport protein
LLRSVSVSAWLVSLAVALFGTSAASASGFSVARFSGEHGHPTTDNPTALYFNPAALRSRRAELFVDGLVGLRRVTYTRSARPTDVPEPPGAEGANVGRAKLVDWLVSPSLWLVVPASKRLVLAAGVFTPFGGPLSWDTRGAFAGSPYPGPVDGVSRFHAIEGLSITTYGSVGGSLSLSDTWRVGLSLSGLYTTVEDVRAWSSGQNGVAGEGRSLLDVNGWAFGFGAGVFYECECRAFRAGLSYQSRPNVAGGMKLGGQLSNDIGGPSSADVKLHQDLPDVVRASVAYEPRPALELRASLAWERWSAFDRQCVTQGGAPCTITEDGGQPDGGSVLQNVPRHFRDAVEARAGASVWTSRDVELFSGVGVMSKAVPDETLEAGLPDFFGVTFSLGSRLRLSDSLSVAGSLSHIVSPARDAKSRLQEYALPSKLPDASGHYTQSLSYANLNASVRF